MFKETEETITLHGLGFLQIKLGGNQRLHVWHPDLPRRKCFAHSAIHNHRFGFVSRVLIGTQINHNIEVTPDRYLNMTHVAYLHEGERTAFGNRPWISDGTVNVRETGVDVCVAGQRYDMEPFAYHWTEPGGDGRVATLMTKTSEGDRGAHSLCAIDIAPDADFDRKQWAEAALWNIALNVLGARASVIPHLEHF